MKKIVTLLLLVTGISLRAQPTITSSTDPVVGTSIVNIFLDSSTVQPGNAGANQTWDFSTAVPNGNMRTEDWLSVASTPYAASFPAADIAQKMVDTSGNIIYQYYYQSTD